MIYKDAEKQVFLFKKWD